MSKMAAESAPRWPGPCDHREAPRSLWTWQPRPTNRVQSVHAWCQRCGAVKYHGQRRGRDLGGLANQLGRLYRVMEHNGVRVADVQRRLIVGRLREMGLDDRFSLDAITQEREVVDVVAAMTGAPRAAVERYLEAA